MKLLRKWENWVEHSPDSSPKHDRPLKPCEKRKDLRGNAEQELTSLLRFGKFELAIVAHRLNIPMKKILEMRSGNYYGDETQWVVKTGQRLRHLVRTKQI